MSNRDIIAIGGSIGTLTALKCIFANLPADLPAAVFVVMHIAADSRDMLAGILDAAGFARRAPYASGALMLVIAVYMAVSGWVGLASGPG
jgi:two-component system, chemotaxis family, protein-glutamate methylesterase/glutaminase